MQMYKKVLSLDKNHVEANANLAHLKQKMKSGELS
jgi:hypothetical protein